MSTKRRLSPSSKTCAINVAVADDCPRREYFDPCGLGQASPVSHRTVRFLAPGTAFQQARKYLATILRKRGIPDSDVLPTLQYLQLMMASVDRQVYELFEGEA